MARSPTRIGVVELPETHIEPKSSVSPVSALERQSIEFSQEILRETYRQCSDAHREAHNQCRADLLEITAYTQRCVDEQRRAQIAAAQELQIAQQKTIELVLSTHELFKAVMRRSIENEAQQVGPSRSAEDRTVFKIGDLGDVLRQGTDFVREGRELLREWKSETLIQESPRRKKGHV